jgi:hypothetical protein
MPIRVATKRSIQYGFSLSYAYLTEELARIGDRAATTVRDPRISATARPRRVRDGASIDTSIAYAGGDPS